MKDMADKDFCKDVKSYLENVSFKEKAALEEFLTEAIRRLDLARPLLTSPSAAREELKFQKMQNYTISAPAYPPLWKTIALYDVWDKAFIGYQPAKGFEIKLSANDIRHKTENDSIAVYNPQWEPKS